MKRLILAAVVPLALVGCSAPAPAPAVPNVPVVPQPPVVADPPVVAQPPAGQGQFTSQERQFIDLVRQRYPQDAAGISDAKLAETGRNMCSLFDQYGVEGAFTELADTTSDPAVAKAYGVFGAGAVATICPAYRQEMLDFAQKYGSQRTGDYVTP